MTMYFFFAPASKEIKIYDNARAFVRRSKEMENHLAST